MRLTRGLVCGSPSILPSKAQIHFTVLQARGLSSTLASVNSDVGSASTVDWSQQISVRWVPRVADPVVARVARTAYGRALVKLLQRS